MPVSRLNKNIRKNDNVMVISGRNKGKSGRVLKIDPANGKLIIEKVNIIKKHQRPSAQFKQGGIIEREGLLRLDCVMIVCPACLKPVRMKIQRSEDGGKRRLCASCNGLLEIKK